MSEERLKQGRTYVAKLRKAGNSSEVIRQKLVDANWSEQDIRAVLAPSPAPVAGRPRRSVDPGPPPLTAADVDPWSVRDGSPPLQPAAATAGSGRTAVAEKPWQKRREPQLVRPGELTFFVVLVDVVAILGVLAALFAILGGLAAMASGVGGVGLIVLALGLFIGVVYVGVLIVGHFLWNGFAWARTAMMVLMGLVIASIVVEAVTGSHNIVSWIQAGIAGLFIFVLFKDEVVAYCSK